MYLTMYVRVVIRDMTERASKVKLMLGDCLELMKDVPDGSVDMILCDLPYGTTACKWDAVIPFAPLWQQYRRVCKPNAAIVLTASQPFTSALVMSNPKDFRYCWVWNKVKAGNFVQSGFMPMKTHEDVAVFYQSKPVYNPQKTKLKKPQKVKDGAQNRKDRSEAGGFGGTVKYSVSFEADKKLPTTILTISKDNYGKNILHPTQKPVALMEYLIRTYTNKGDTVLDNCMGSGTTGVACVNTYRDFIGIERDPEYFEIATGRIAVALPKQLQMANVLDRLS